MGRKHKYVMQLDAELSEGMIAHVIESIGEHAVPFATQSWFDHVERVGQEALKASGQKRRGYECDVSGEHPRFTFDFEGNSKGAERAYVSWCEAVDDLGGTGRILIAHLNGSDGTELGYMDETLQEELEHQFEGLSPETRERMEKLIEP